MTAHDPILAVTFAGARGKVFTALLDAESLEVWGENGIKLALRPPGAGVTSDWSIIAGLVSALREARRENAELRAEIERTSLALGEGPYSSISEHAAALKMELAIEQHKDHAYQSWTNGYNAAVDDWREHRTALWLPKRKRKSAASRVPETEDRQ